MSTSIPEVAELKRILGDVLANQCDALLQQIALGAAHPHRIALDASLDLELAILSNLTMVFARSCSTPALTSSC